MKQIKHKNRKTIENKLDLSSKKIATLAGQVSSTLAQQSANKKLGINYIFARVVEEIALVYGEYEYLTMSNLFHLKDPGRDRLNDKEKLNFKYIKRYIHRLEKQKLVKIIEKDDKQYIEITNNGKKKILKLALDQIKIAEPKHWDETWWLVSYDLPGPYSEYRDIIRKYFLKWGFYPFHKSVYLHAFPCADQVEFIREYYGLGKYIRILQVKNIEYDSAFKKFFNLA